MCGLSGGLVLRSEWASHRGGRAAPAARPRLRRESWPVRRSFQPAQHVLCDPMYPNRGHEAHSFRKYTRGHGKPVPINIDYARRLSPALLQHAVHVQPSATSSNLNAVNFLPGLNILTFNPISEFLSSSAIQNIPDMLGYLL